MRPTAQSSGALRRPKQAQGMAQILVVPAAIACRGGRPDNERLYRTTIWAATAVSSSTRIGARRGRRLEMGGRFLRGRRRIPELRLRRPILWLRRPMLRLRGAILLLGLTTRLRFMSLLRLTRLLRLATLLRLTRLLRLVVHLAMPGCKTRLLVRAVALATVVVMIATVGLRHRCCLGSERVL